MAEIVDEALQQMKKQFALNKLRVSCVHAPDLPPALCDREKTQQVLFHLLNNAIKYTPEGGSVTVTLKAGARVRGMHCHRHRIRHSTGRTGAGIR